MKMIKMADKMPITLMLKSSVVKLPTPNSISYLWNMGFLLGMTLTMQIVTGVFLAMNYIPEISLAFSSVMHIMRDVEGGWMTRYSHMNGASLFFILLYSHMARGVYFSSPSKMPMVWTSGVVILLLSMLTAFMGYVLPWGQMSYWGATVITSMLSAVPYIGVSLTEWLWGNFSVSQPTLNRFFSLHFFMPMMITAMVIIHLILLHKTGSSNPTNTSPDLDKMTFFPSFLVKDMNPLLIIMVMMILVITTEPELLGDVENLNQASMAVTPPHIQPEWYFLFSYAILRSIPSKLGGVVAMAFSILVSLTLAFKNNSKSAKFDPKKKLFLWSLLSVLMILTWVGANPVEEPFSELGQVFTAMYFMIYILL